MLEAVRAGVGPAGLVTDRADLFLALASVVSDEMYSKSFPILAVERAAFEGIPSGLAGEISDGCLRLRSAEL